MVRCPEHPQIVAGEPNGDLFMHGGFAGWKGFQDRRRGRLVREYLNTRVDERHLSAVKDKIRPHCGGIPGWDAP